MQQDVLTGTAAPEPAPAPSTRRRQIADGVRDSSSAGLGIFPLGIALGLLIIQAGLPWWLAPALSLAAFAGSLELLLVGMMATVTPLAAVALTVLVVNFRHVFYAFSFPLHLVKHRHDEGSDEFPLDPPAHRRDVACNRNLRSRLAPPGRARAVWRQKVRSALEMRQWTPLTMSTTWETWKSAAALR
ncbi:AzlC family ABC transporter permease [Streptomyces sp. R35]|uniref:AzlC family ABC transporter permease n=1 Tax=Streptomyces sp. R35 TaxID=3238630 RepID=A0AB39SF21_9ACTN